MEQAAKVRQYRPSDGRAIRQIACDTADRGRPVDGLFGDREAVADILLGGYMDYEPGFLWVGEYENQVVGYLTGCPDTRAFERLLEKKVVPRVVLRSVRRGALLHLRTWRLLGAFAATVLLGGFPPRIDLNTYPAHFHINLRQDFRGRGLGRQLVESFRRQVDLAGIGGIHVVARGDNPGGRRFFEAMGFRLLFERPLVLPRGRWFVKVSTVVYGWNRED